MISSDVLMAASQPIRFGRQIQPHPVGEFAYRFRMPTRRESIRRRLWEAADALMDHAYGKENLGRLASESGFGPATSTRLKKQDTNVGIDVLEAIARRFKFEPWQLLVPGFDPKNPPVLADSDAMAAVTPEERALLKHFRSLSEDVDREALLRTLRIPVDQGRGTAQTPDPEVPGAAGRDGGERRHGERRKSDRRAA